VIVTAVIYVESNARNEASIDGFAVAVLAISALFGLFTFTMTATSVRYILVNLTTVDYVKSKTLVHQLAIRVPRGTPSCQDYPVITYPLPKPVPGQAAASESSCSRDQLATRSFAIVKTEMGENPWDLGFYRNWISVMGDNIIDWLLPFNLSPCVSYESNESFYEMGPLVQRLRARFHLPELSDELQKSEMGEREAEVIHGV
jgi:palmitoyltransferase